MTDEPIWNKFLTERDKAVFATSGYGTRAGFGKRPALLVIDVNYAYLRRQAGADPARDLIKIVAREIPAGPRRAGPP